MRYITGDILKVVPSPGVILHSCNCQGFWGGGVARALALEYPNLYKTHRSYVSKKNASSLLGTCQIIKDPLRYIVCIFTSLNGGGAADSSESILANTDKSLRNLSSLVESLSQFVVDGKVQIFLPQINSGIFNTPWEKTESVLKKYEDVFDFTVVIYG